MNPMQEYDWKVIEKFHQVPKIKDWNLPTLGEMYVPTAIDFDFSLLPFSFPFPRSDWVYVDSVITRQWYIPMMLEQIEERINNLVNKIFQENPSLP